MPSGVQIDTSTFLNLCLSDCQVGTQTCDIQLAPKNLINSIKIGREVASDIADVVVKEGKDTRKWSWTGVHFQTVL